MAVQLQRALNAALADGMVNSEYTCGAAPAPSKRRPENDEATDVPSDSEDSDSPRTPDTMPGTPEEDNDSDAPLSSHPKFGGQESHLRSKQHLTVSSDVAGSAGPRYLAHRDGRLQVVQAADKVRLSLDACSEKKVVAKKPPVRPPGIFFVPTAPGLHRPVLPSPGLPAPFRPPPGLPPPPGLAPPEAPCEPCRSTVEKKKSVDAKDAPRTRTLTPNSFAWVVDARKLRSKDNVIVSPRFEVDFESGPVGFRVVMNAKEISYKTGSVSFQQARGAGTLTVKSETSVPGVVSIDVAVGQCDRKEPVLHEFSEHAVCKLPDVWKFGKQIDEATQTVEIQVSIH